MHLKILLAEDSLVNQKVASGLLRKAGHEVKIVENGLEAIESWNSGRFDLILMDIQMPEMDGLQAARHIREKDTKIPIIALSGNDDESSRNECFDSGMNDFVTKPLRVTDIESRFQKILNNNNSVEHEHLTRPAKEPTDTKNPFDFKTALKNVGGDEEILRSTAELLFEECPKQIERIRQSLDQDDKSQLVKAAHTLKSTFALFAANSAMHVAKKIEDFDRNENQENLEAAISNLKIESDRVMASIANTLNLNRND